MPFIFKQDRFRIRFDNRAPKSFSVPLSLRFPDFSMNLEF